ncbi:glycosyltransferase family 2 protein [Psychrobacter frigidicola]|uniref:Glycosyltransferase family 2 protein n=1 Tax=Psychrobacter frigidicola TaxID=45611 RepID=A0A5C7A5Y6_9GAMM|nr:glycosyltransferase family A protein [Psychrobacter frigidicola]TXD98095.1 glycosyltransferase family 2 protein [Psychrobacter frigidicola]
MQYSQPLVSVVIPCYNHEEFVKDSIKSVIEQTYENIELIVIDDGSKDNSVLKIKEMVKICEERFVKFEFRNRPNKGLSSTLNEAMEWCTGEYFSVIASDDQMFNYKTSVQVNFLENNRDYVAVFGGVQVIDENNRKLEKFVRKARAYSFDDIIMHKHSLLAPTQMIRMNNMRKTGGYKPNMFIEDWYMWLLLSREANIFNMDEVFAFYRKHDANISKDFRKMNSGRLEVLSFFSDSKLYVKAVNNIKWHNTYKELIYLNNNKLLNMVKLVILDPKKTSKILVKTIFKKFL